MSLSKDNQIQKNNLPKTTIPLSNSVFFQDDTHFSMFSHNPYK